MRIVMEINSQKGWAGHVARRG